MTALDHEVVEDLPVLPRHVHVAPLSTVLLEEETDLAVEGVVVGESGRSPGQGHGDDGEKNAQGHAHRLTDPRASVHPALEVPARTGEE